MNSFKASFLIFCCHVMCLINFVCLIALTNFVMTLNVVNINPHKHLPKQASAREKEVIDCYCDFESMFVLLSKFEIAFVFDNFIKCNKGLLPTHPNRFYYVVDISYI